jgi:CRP-like cAMP-binding protein
MPSAPFDAGHLLRGLNLFREAPEPTVARLAASVRRVHLVRGDELFRSGEVSEGLYVLTKGQIKVYARADNGQEKVIEVVSAPACLGGSLLLADVTGQGGAVMRHVSHASALTEAHLLLLPRAQLLAELQADPRLAVRLLAEVSGRLNRLVRDIEAVTLHTAAQRVVSYLLRTSPQAATSACTVSLPASKGTIASLLSVTPEHFSRILHDLQSRGLIAVNRREIVIPDVERLAGCV